MFQTTLHPSSFSAPKTSRYHYHLLPLLHFPRRTQHPLSPLHTEDHLNDRNEYLHKVDPNPQRQIRYTEDRSSASAECAVREFERQLGAQMILCNLQTAGEAVFMESVFGPGTAVADSSRVLDTR